MTFHLSSQVKSMEQHADSEQQRVPPIDEQQQVPPPEGAASSDVFDNPPMSPPRPSTLSISSSPSPHPADDPEVGGRVGHESPARRVLFGDADDQAPGQERENRQARQFLEEEASRSVEARQRWGFDFREEQPVEGSGWTWQQMPENDPRGIFYVGKRPDPEPPEERTTPSGT